MTPTRAVAPAEAPAATPERLRQLAGVVRRLAPDRRQPDRFHETKSDIEAELRRLAAELEAASRR